MSVKEIREDLEAVARKYADGELGRDAEPYNELSNLVFAMETHRILRCGGRALSEWQALVKHIGRAHFHRTLEFSMRAGMRDMTAGLATADINAYQLPDKLYFPTLLFRLESLDKRRALVCEVKMYALLPAPVKFGQYGLTLRLDDPELTKRRPHVSVYAHFRKPDVAHPSYCPYCGTGVCVRSHRFGDSDPIVKAYVDDGITGVWCALDRVWSELLSYGRFDTVPLSSQALAVRWEVHRDRPVRVVTREGVFAGMLRDCARNSDGSISSVTVKLRRPATEDVYGNHLAFGAENILDILPYRLL
jgi:hypothetical protein